MHAFGLQRAGLGFVLFLLLAPAGISAEEQDEAQFEPGREVFVEVAEPQCRVCHALADAEATGTIAPSLDDLQPTKEQVQAAVRTGAGPVTIGDLKRDSKLLEIGCLGCGRHVYVDATGVGLPDDLPVPNAAARLACSGCGAINQDTWHPIYARPDARASGVL